MILKTNEHLFQPFGDKQVTVTKRRSGFREVMQDVDVSNLTAGEVVNLLQTYYNAGCQDTYRNVSEAMQKEASD